MWSSGLGNYGNWDGAGSCEIQAWIKLKSVWERLPECGKVPAGSGRARMVNLASEASFSACLVNFVSFSERGTLSVPSARLAG